MATRSKTSGRHLLLYASPDTSADIRYASGFSCPDPFIFVRTATGRRVMVMSDLEIDRARATSSAHRVLSASHYTGRAAQRYRKPGVAHTIREVLRDLKIRSVTVPGDFDVRVADTLRRLGVGVRTVAAPFFPERAVKSEEEVRCIESAMRATLNGMRAAVAMLRASRIRNGWVAFKGKRLTAERLRIEANRAVLDGGCLPAHTIVAPGEQGCDPHERGHGPIRAHVPIIIDIFPRSEATGYFGDMTRTFVKGVASPQVRAMHRAVAAAQRFALASIRPGVNGNTIHTGIQELFVSRGFETGEIDGRMQGFFHGTGHGVGLDIHERPSIGRVSDTLRKGHVVTVEPGLYYVGHGGVRIEDTVLVTATGIRNLTRFSKTLEIP